MKKNHLDIVKRENEIYEVGLCTDDGVIKARVSVKKGHEPDTRSDVAKRQAALGKFKRLIMAVDAAILVERRSSVQPANGA